MKILVKIDIFYIRVLVRVIRLFHKITGYDHRNLAIRFLQLSRIVFYLYTIKNIVYNRDIFWGGFSAIWWFFLYKHYENKINTLANEWENSNGFIPTEFLNQMPQRVTWTTFVLLFSIILAIDPNILILSWWLISLALYTAAIPFNSGKTIKDRAKNALDKTVQTIQGLVPNPALQPVTNYPIKNKSYPIGVRHCLKYSIQTPHLT